ncbi:MAG TPA: signal peptidase II [Polyangiaceae bacterium]|nr:signal peptidase II [Polyangiaceae bacterium]
MTDPHDGPELPAPPADLAEAPAPEPTAAPAAAELTAFPESTTPSAVPLATGTPAPASLPPGPRPTFLFFGCVAAVSLIADVSTKAWAEITLSRRSPLLPSIELVKEHLGFTLAYNPGGAWGLFQRQSEYVRRPFFLLVSLLAIAFIINLYGRLTPQQKALKWGLPLVLGGALGNLSDRIVRSNVIDFIDYQAKWIETMNRTIAKFVSGWAITDHWPTFNVADIAICVGVGLMAVDMFTSRRGASASLPPRPPTPLAAAEPAPVAQPAPPLAEPTPPLKPEA